MDIGHDNVGRSTLYGYNHLSVPSPMHCHLDYPSIPGLTFLHWPHFLLYIKSCMLAKHHFIPYVSHVNKHFAQLFDLYILIFEDLGFVISWVDFEYFVPFNWLFSYKLASFKKILWIILYFHFHMEIHTKFGRSIKTFHSDNVLEYLSNDFCTFLQNHEIQGEISYTDAIAKWCNNWHFMEVTWLSLFEIKIPNSYQANVISTTRSRALVCFGWGIPYSLLFPTCPLLSHLLANLGDRCVLCAGS